MRDPEDIHDEWLVLRCQEDDAAALTELVERWQPRLLRHAMHLAGDRDGANDVVQQAWVAIIHGLRRLSDASRFRSWAYQIVTHKSADWIRRRQRERRTAADLAIAERESVVSAETAQAAAEDSASLRVAIQRLSPDRRAALSMFYIDEMSLTEIAEALSLPIGTVKSRLHYARQELKVILEREQQ
ncbi:MAG: RNA polymerase sigma factor [Pirellulales bacterium]